MSEVVGQILIFGILAMILVLSLVGFNSAKDGAERRVADANAESLAQRVASAVVDGALFAETAPDGDVLLQMRLDLPARVEGDVFTIDLDEDDVTVTVTSLERSASAPLFASGTPAEVAVCDQAAFPGGPIILHVSSTPPTGDCGAPPPSRLYVYLEPAA